MRIHRLSVWLRPTLIVSVLLASPQFGFASAPTNNGDEIAIRLPAVGGHVAKADLLAQLGRIAGLNLKALPWLLPDSDIDLNQSKVAPTPGAG